VEQLQQLVAKQKEEVDLAKTVKQESALLRFTDWTAEELLKFNRWDGKEGVTTYPNKPSQLLLLIV
jgi:hypothetical protein